MNNPHPTAGHGGGGGGPVTSMASGRHILA